MSRGGVAQVVIVWLCTTLTWAAGATPSGGWPHVGANNQNTGFFAGTLSTGEGIQWGFDSGNAVSYGAVLTSDQSKAIFVNSGAVVWAVAVPDTTQSLWSAIWHGVRAPSSVWSCQLLHSSTTYPALSPDEESVYVGDSGGYLYSIGVASGSIQWSLHLPDSRGLASAITVSPSGTVLVGGSLGHMFAVHADGTFGWSCATQGAVIGAPVLNPEGSAVYFASTDTYVYAVGLGEDNSCKDANAVCRDDPLTNATGCSLWNVKLSPDPIQRGTVLDATRNRLYVTSGGGQSGHGQLFALQMNPDGGLSHTSAVYTSATQITSSPAIVIAASGPVIAFGAADGNLYAVNGSEGSGEVVWSHTSGGSVVTSKPCSNGQYVAYGSTSEQVYVLDAASGQQLAEVDVGGSVSASPAVTAQGWVVVGDASGVVWSLGGTSPDFLTWRLALGGVGLAVVVAMCCLVYCCCFRKRKRKPHQSGLLDTALEEHETSYSAPLMMNLDRSGTDRRTTAKASGF